MVGREYLIGYAVLALVFHGILEAGIAKAEDNVVIVSDAYLSSDEQLWQDSGLTDEVVPAQFQARSRGSAQTSRTSTRLAGQTGGGQRNVQISQLRLANTPNMMGDFFGVPGQTAIVGELFTGNGSTNGLAVHQTVQSGSSFADDNISLITVDQGTGHTVFIGGPGGVTPGTFFLPSIPPSEIQNPQTGLTLDSGDPDIFYTAVLNGEEVNVYDDPNGPVTIPDAPIYQVFQVTEINIPGPNVGDVAGRVRVQDNNSTMPRDRVFFDYNYFHNVPFTANGIDVNRFTPGVEKTFWNGMASLEVRVPMAVTFNTTQSLAAGPDANKGEFGDLALISKFLLTSNDSCALAAGMAVALPTADNYELYGINGEKILEIENDSVHLIPFLAFLYTPERSNYFVQSFITVDVDANGNPVFGNMGASGLENIGDWNDQTYLTGSAAIGRFIYQNNSRNANLQAVALISEFHYTATANDADIIRNGPFQLGNPGQDLSLLNGVFGANFRFQNYSLTTGYSVPLTSDDRIFDGEARVFLNRFF
jgi:hypothetical protein